MKYSNWNTTLKKNRVTKDVGNIKYSENNFDSVFFDLPNENVGFSDNDRLTFAK